MNLSIPLPRLRGMAVLTAFVAVIFLLTACSSSKKEDTKSTPSGGAASSAPTAKPADTKVVNGYSVCSADGAKELTGAGATFPFPLYSKWIDEYQKVCGTKINYQSVGSGAGIQQITAKTVDYGASDGIMTDAQEKDATAAGGPILHIPMTLAPVVVVVNLPGIAKNQLKMTPEVLSGIYLKTIKKWNDPALTAANPGVTLPNTDITVVHRSDGSGTTNIFTNYLSKVNQTWKDKVGAANSVEWPGDVGGQGNEGVAGQVKQLPGTIGYVELAYAKQNNLAYVQLKNKSGNFIEPTLESAAKAVDGVTLPDDMKVVVTDSTNAQAYPIVSFTWVLAYQNAADPAKGKALASYLWWSIHNGQPLGIPLDYPGLSPDAVKKAEAEILKLTCGGGPCLTKAAS
jgi:phosphate transport system substrate-binding protein